MLTQARLVPLVAVLAASSILLGACAPLEARPGAEKEAAPGAADKETPKPGGIWVSSAGSSSTSGTDPAMGQMSYRVWPQIGLYILKRQPETWEIVGDAVERWEFSKDGKELALHIRRGVRFGNKPPVNGREVEAKDIVYSLKGMTGQLYPQLPAVRFPRRSNLESMVDAVALDKYTVKVTLSQPDPLFLDGLQEYRSGIVLPEGIREHFGGVESLAEPSVERYISGGPFVLSKFVQLTETVYERNPDYWKEGKPYLDGIRELFIPDASTEAAAFVAGQVDVRSITSEADRTIIVRGKPDAVIVSYGPSSCWNRFAMNSQVKPFDDVRVRKALALVVNPVEIGKAVIGDWQGKPLWKLPGPLPWVFPESLTQEELAKMPQYESPKSQATIEMARKLLAEAGYSGGFEFEMMGYDRHIKDWGLLAQAQIEKALPGVKIKLTPLDNAINQNRAAKGDFQMQAYCYIHETNGLAHMKTTSHAKGGRNHAYLRDAKMDKFLDDAARELDPEKRKALIRESQLYFLEIAPYIPSYHNEVLSARQPWVRGLRDGPASSSTAWYEDVWFASTPKR